MEQLICTVVANAGESRSYSLEAIEFAKAGDFEKAEETMKKANEALILSHDAHTSILAKSVDRSDMPITFIFVHATNHMSVAEVTKDMAENIIDILKEVKGYA